MLQNILWMTLAFVAFAVIHSLTAGTGVPTRLKRYLPPRMVDGWYRLAYNAFSFVTFLPVVLASALVPDRALFSASQLVALALRCLQLAALVGLAWSLWSIDFWRFAGLRQAWAYANGDMLPLRDEPLQQRGVYSLMRHPLYVFSLVFLWASPTLTLNGLLFNLCATLYFLIGAMIEERRLIAAYGDAYGDYRRAVHWLPTRSNRQ
jgi:protein-S-isoprenylcysteine O-methyltransferase Ste14